MIRPFLLKNFMKDIIPLFPLNTVVYPNSRIPLHIFEERYKILIGKCLQEKSGFGMISIINNKLSNVGSYVEITSILNQYSNGEMDIVIQGKKRFKVFETHQHPDGYLTGKVESYTDIFEDFDKNSLEKLRNNFLSILTKINFKLENTFWENYKKSKLKSYKIAEKSGLTLEQQQELLEIQEEDIRIDYLLNHIAKLEKQLAENVATGAIVMGDGYL